MLHVSEWWLNYLQSHREFYSVLLSVITSCVVFYCLSFGCEHMHACVHVCLVLSRTLDENILHEVMDAVTTGRLLWSWLEVLWCLGGTRIQRLHLNVSILNVTLTLTDRGGRSTQVHNNSQLRVLLTVQKFYQLYSEIFIIEIQRYCLSLDEKYSQSTI